MNSVSTKCFILLLGMLNPKSFISGRNIDISKVMQTYNRAEFHHMFPKKILEDNDEIENDPNCLANLCVLSSTDNSQIRAKKPSEYKRLMPNDPAKILKRCAASPVLFGDDYDAFIKERSGILAEIANRLVSGNSALETA